MQFELLTYPIFRIHVGGVAGRAGHSLFDTSVTNVYAFLNSVDYCFLGRR